MAIWDKDDDFLNGGFGESDARKKKSVGGFSAPSEEEEPKLFDPLGSVALTGIDPGKAVPRQAGKPFDGNPLEGLDQLVLAEHMDLSSIEWQVYGLQPVPRTLKGKCKWLEGENYPVLKCYNRRSFILFFGTFWSVLSFIGLGIPMVKMLTTGEMVGSFTNNTGLPDDVAFVLFALVFMSIGLIFLIVGIRQVFMSTWITFKGGYLEVRHAFFREGESVRFLLRNCALETKSTSTENKEPVYSVTMRNYRTGKHVLIVQGLKGQVVQAYPEYLERLINQCRSYAKEHGGEFV